MTVRKLSFIYFGVWFPSLFAASILLSNIDASACSRNTDCRVGERVYRVVLPTVTNGRTVSSAVIFVHGYMGSADNVLRNNDLVSAVTSQGSAFVAAQAVGIEWNVPGVPTVDARPGVDELEYFDRVASDLKQRFGIRRRNIVVAGFSSGAMMVWHLACQQAETFAGFVAFSGTFWRPLPKACPLRSINLIHYHGKSDAIVPIHGRPIKDGYQGDVYEAIALMMRAGKFGPAQSEDNADLDCKHYQNANGNVLELCLFAGGHELRPKYLERAWRKIMVKQ